MFVLPMRGSKRPPSVTKKFEIGKVPELVKGTLAELGFVSLILLLGLFP
jgi:hypothetical protein